MNECLVEITMPYLVFAILIILGIGYGFSYGLYLGIRKHMIYLERELEGVEK